MSSLIQISAHTRKKPGPSPEFVAMTKALAAEVLTEREWNAFVGNVLATRRSATGSGRRGDGR